MPRVGWVPKQLRDGPFSLAEAQAAGLEKWHLQHGPWRRLGPRTYVFKRLADNPRLLLQSVLHRLPEEAAFSGPTSAWLHGLDVAPCSPIDVTVPLATGVAVRTGMRIRRSLLMPDEVVARQGLRATGAPRMLRECCGRLSLTEAVVLIDMALYAQLLTIEELEHWITAQSGRVGIKRLREGLRHAEPLAESPMESRLRMLLVLAGLPRPLANVTIRDPAGTFVRRIDLYYPEYRLGVEYDGSTHRDSLAEDNRRQNQLLGLGIRLLRFTASDINSNPAGVAALVRGHLRPAA